MIVRPDLGTLQLYSLLARFRSQFGLRFLSSFLPSAILRTLLPASLSLALDSSTLAPRSPKGEREREGE